MSSEAFPISTLAGWEIFLNPSLAVLAPPLGELLNVLPRKGIACKATSPFLSRRRFSVVVKKLRYNASSSALHAMALAANREQILRPVLIVAAQGKSGRFSKAFLGASLISPLALAARVVAL